jgi:pimeloyl-ACP methyl ester carboxylesterase
MEPLIEFARRPPEGIREEDLANVPCPVLIVQAEHDEVLGATRLAELVPTTEVVVVSGIDHFALPRDFRCVDAVMRFLEQIV